jgi:histone deacetylase 1/2
LYGLKQAPRAWFSCLSTKLHDFGFTDSKADNSLFIRRKDGVLTVLLIYVDDILETGSSASVIHHFIRDLPSEFVVKDLGNISYFMGIEVLRSNDGRLYRIRSLYNEYGCSKTLQKSHAHHLQIVRD